nr:thiosulfate sulfurtransferase 16, chloroplastic-like [Ipomoea batatas]
MMKALSLPSTSSLLPDQTVISNSTRRCRVVPMMARSQFRVPQRRNLGGTYKTPNFSWMAAVGEKVESTTMPASVPVRVAHELLQAGHRYLDVRTPEEFMAGHAVGAINIPYMFKVGSGMSKNPRFLEEVLEHFGKDDEIIVGCQLGKRSLMAAIDLVSAGFTGITDIAGGYAAWTQNGLPTES